jgi:hypothetical protein
MAEDAPAQFLSCEMQCCPSDSTGRRETLLEMYVAIALETPYNDFDNH